MAGQALEGCVTTLRVVCEAPSLFGTRDTSYRTTLYQCPLLATNSTSWYICRYYWWPAMGTDIELFCRTCPSCQITKEPHKRPEGLLHTLPVPEWPWQSVGIDFMGPLPMSDTHDYLLVVIDHLTLQVHLMPMTTCMTSKEVTWLFIKEVVRSHGMPESIVSDRDTKFTSNFWKEIH